MTESTPKTSSLLVSGRTFVFRLVASILSINLFVVGLAGFSLYHSRKLYYNRVANQTQNLSQSLSLTLAGIIDKTSIALLSLEFEMEKQIRSGRIDSQSLGSLLLNQKRHIPEIDGLRIANVHGDVIYRDRTDPGSPANNIADRDHFIYARNNPDSGLIISKPLFGRYSKKWQFNVDRRINNPDGSFAGIVYGSISLDYLLELFSRFDLGKHGAITLRDGELTVVVRYPEPYSIGSKSVSREWRAQHQAGQTTGTYTTSGSLDKIERTFSYYKIPGYPLYVNVGLATGDYLTSWRNEAMILLTFVLLFSSGSLVSAWLIYRNRKREEQAEAELIGHRDHLEKTVRERTSDLEAKNIQLTEETVLRKQTEDHLKKTAIIMDKMTDSVAWISRNGNFLYVNDAACGMYGYTREEMLSISVSDVVPHFPSEAWHNHWEELERVKVLHFETVNRTRDGHEFPVEVTSNYLDIDSIEYNCAIIRDISERKAAEAEKQHLMAQLNQSQKIESIGRLAGGVAHDFNNMLGVILGHAELALMHLDPGQSTHAHLTEILNATERSANLTRQLLAFARKQTITPKVLDLNETVASMFKMLHRLIGEDIRLTWQPAANLWLVKIDPSQIDQILANLCVNSRDAISGLGVIAMETQNSTIDAGYCAVHGDAAPGEYVRIAVSDNGCGMDKETLSHIFEPFFTTKETGTGTGLGLATVYGIVRQNNGFINIYSEPGQGTTFTIYLPRHDGETEAVAGDEAPLMRGNETILLVEDEPANLEITAMMLQNLGYAVHSASTPGEAIRLAREHASGIHLLITDVIMPEMNGQDLSTNVLSVCSHVKLLFMSGYTANVITHHCVLDEGINFIQKPFTTKDLATKIRDVLNRTM